MEINAVNGTYILKAVETNKLRHDLAVFVPASVTAGSLVITGKKPGSSVFEAIGTINLATPNTLLFDGAVREYQFVLTGVSGSGTLLITDTVAT